MWATRLALPVCTLTVLAHAQLRILAPESLAREFPETHGIVYGTTATFGAPYYGERVLGRLLYGESHGKDHCTEGDYTVDLPTENSGVQGQELVNVVLVRRGKCTFVNKVLVAEKKQAHAVVVVDKANSKLTSEDIQHIVMGHSGRGDSVKIPSVLVSRFDGQKLIDAALKGPVIVELAWDIPRAKVVIADFWMSSGSRESNEFLERFKDSAEALKYHLQFVPHYHVFSLPAGSGNSFGRLCTDSGSRYCAPDPDGPGPVTGADVAEEDLRQLCILNTTARSSSSFHSASFSKEFWDYVVRFFEECPIKDVSEDQRFGERCSQLVMDKVGISRAKVDSCVQQNRVPFFELQLKNVAWSPQALRLNGWRYSGPLDPETVLKAVCSGYADQPHECSELLSGYRGVIWNTEGLTFSVFIWSIFFLALLLVAIFFLYRRHVTSSVRKVLREEVMLEVQTQMADYAPLQDGLGRPGGRPTLSF